MSDVTPQIELLPQASPDGVTFTFAAGRPLRSVAVAGTFNSWRGDASPLQRIDAGRWQTTLPVSPGRHLYKYVLDGEEWVRDPANPWVSEDGQGNSCFTLTEAGELYVRRGEFGPTHPGPLFRDHAATPSPEWLRDAVIYELSARAVGGLSGVRELIRQIARGEAEPLALQRYWEEATYSLPRGALRMRWLEEKEQGRAFRYFGRALHAAAASLLLTLDGAPMLLMGQEFEEPGWQSWETLFEPFALGRPPAGSAIFAHYRALLGLRASHAALRRGEVQFVPAGAERVVRYWRVLGAERLCVTVNLAGEWRTPAAHPAPVELLYRHGRTVPERDALPPFGTIIERAL